MSRVSPIPPNAIAEARALLERGRRGPEPRARREKAREAKADKWARFFRRRMGQNGDPSEHLPEALAALEQDLNEAITDVSLTLRTQLNQLKAAPPVAVKVNRADFSVTLIMSDGSEGPQIELRELFEEFAAQGGSK
jgi:hypothetical protein